MRETSGPASASQADLSEMMRQRLLAATDWIEAIPGAAPDHQPWVEYRRRLQELPRHPGWPHRIVWPRPPVRPPLRGDPARNP